MSKEQGAIGELISQLDEAKFSRFARLLCSHSRYTGEIHPIPLPHAELWYQWAGGGSVSLGSKWEALWLFQPAYLPHSLDQEDVRRAFFATALRSSLIDLRKLGGVEGLLDRILGKGESGFYNDTIDYNLVVNVAGDWYRWDSGEGLLRQEWDDLAKELFQQILERPFGGRLGFGLGSPESMLAESEEEVRDSLVELINTPSSYCLVAREGRILAVPETHHGLYFATDTPEATIGDSGRGFSATVSSVLRKPGVLTDSLLLQFQDLLSAGSTKEADVQHFLQENPELLLGIEERYCEVRPQVCLLDATENRLIPDFMARIEDSQIWDLIELKLPAHPITVAHRAKASAAAARGISQLLRYREFFATRKNRKKFLEQYAGCPYEPGLVLVIGRGRRAQHYEWQSVKLQFPKVKVVPYDYLVHRARELRGRWLAREAVGRGRSGGLGSAERQGEE